MKTIIALMIALALSFSICSASPGMNSYAEQTETPNFEVFKKDPSESNKATTWEYAVLVLLFLAVAVKR